MGLAIFDERLPFNPSAAINAPGTGDFAALGTLQESAYRFDAVYVTNTDHEPHKLTAFWNDNPLLSFVVPGADSDGEATVVDFCKLLGAIGSVQGMVMTAYDVLKFRLEDDLTGGTQILVQGQGGSV